MKSKTLKLFNGRLIGYEHGYIAAYSQADAVRIYEQYVGGRGTLPEIRDYWHEGSWGNDMIGVTPRRGMFAKTKDGTLVEFVGFDKTKPLTRDDPQTWEAHQAEERKRREGREASKQRKNEERCERVFRLWQTLASKVAGFHQQMRDNDVIELDFEGHKYEIREVE